MYPMDSFFRGDRELQREEGFLAYGLLGIERHNYSLVLGLSSLIEFGNIQYDNKYFYFHCFLYYSTSIHNNWYSEQCSESAW